MKLSESGMRYLGVSSFVFALLQTLCPAVIALSAVRLAIGLGAVAFATSTVAFLKVYHGDWIRLPMMFLALAGATVNLFVIWQLRRLRQRPAAQCAWARSARTSCDRSGYRLRSQCSPSFASRRNGSRIWRCITTFSRFRLILKVIRRCPARQGDDPLTRARRRCGHAGGRCSPEAGGRHGRRR
jgi:hypothetical protein